MGLSAQDMGDMDRLARLAQSAHGVDRAEIYLAVASLYRIQKDDLSDRESALMRDILRRITKDVDVSVRRALAERLADDASAPRGLVRLLAEDVIEVARPILARSILLTDDDMMHLIAETDVEHREAIAERRNIGVSVSDALSRRDEKSVEPAPKSPPVAGAQKLIDKLSDSGQLKAGYLLRVLNQGQTELFDMALAKLVNLPVMELRSRFYRGGPRAVALACRGVGIDRCVFPTVFNLSRRAHNMHVDLSGTDLAEVDKVFSTVPKSSALSELASLTFN